MVTWVLPWALSISGLDCFGLSQEEKPLTSRLLQGFRSPFSQKKHHFSQQKRLNNKLCYINLFFLKGQGVWNVYHQIMTTMSTDWKSCPRMAVVIMNLSKSEFISDGPPTKISGDSSPLPQTSTSWWLNQPIRKIWVKMGSPSPIFGLKSKKYLSCHHLATDLSFCFPSFC